MPETAAPIDPKRPWITDPRDAPTDMNWLKTFTDPSGETSRVHFTRAWTGLFFIRLLYLAGTMGLFMIFAAAGAENPASFVPPAWLWLVVVLVTALASAVAHVRRLASARRSAAWAALVLLPVLAGAGGFLAGAAMGAQAYQAQVQQAERQRAEMPAPPQTPPAEGETAGETSTDSAAGSAEGRDGARERRRGGPPGPDITEVSARDFALSQGVNMAITFWALPSFLVMLWTLFWVGRLPNGGGTIRERLAAETGSQAG